MRIKVKAVYERGVLKPLEPLALPENQTVSLELTPLEIPAVPPSDLASLYGIWQSGASELDAALAAARQATNARLKRLRRDTP